MISRRALLSSIALLPLSLCAVAVAQSRDKRASASQDRRYTKAVREVTAKIQIDRARWKYMICHHSAMKEGNAATYDKQHRKRRMENGLAYHFVIGNGVDSGEGHIEVGQRWVRQIKGGHVKSDALNEVGIGICLVGNFEVAAPSARQIDALCELIDYLRAAVGKHLKLQSHAEAHPGHTACPGKYFPLKRLHARYG